ncbi:LysR family transcriptional regulator [Marinomonas sp. MED121]|uniref:LysR family transcriptional regulator n=1 Tax=Marinomonas sp. MED121 TaxID=314277 RepID=UPI0002D540BA|nr:LysR family transcriptional regulator [Marinomonas sp. MED121]
MDNFERASLFIKVVDQGSLVAAARLLDISPSVVSKRLAELEAELGVQLLRRTTRRISLTEAGEAFYKQMRHLKGQWQSLIDETISLGQEAKGVLTLAAPQPVLTRVLLDAVTQFQTGYPHIKLVLQSWDYEDLPNHQADLSLCRKLDTLDTATTVGLPICPYVNRLFAAPTYFNDEAQVLTSQRAVSTSNKMPQTVSDLSQHSCLTYGQQTQNTWRFANGEAVDVNANLVSNNTEVIIQAAIAAKGIIYIPEMIIEAELAQAKLIPVLPSLTSGEFQLWAYYQKLDYVPLKVRVFLDFIKAYFNET